MTRSLANEGSGLVERLVDAAGPAWRAFTDHAFVRELAAGTLHERAFRFYLVQDYLFLVHFSRAWAMAAFKAEAIEDIRACAATVNALANEEMRLHVAYCAEFGLSEADMASTPEHPANMAYTRFVMERGLTGDLLDLLAALAPCVLGYGVIGQSIASNPPIPLETHPYRAWIDTYGGTDYAAVVTAATDQLERVATSRIGPQPWTSPRWPSLCSTFEAACRLEAGFWQMGLDAA